MNKLEKFRIFWKFFKDVVSFIIATFLIIVISVHFVFGEGYAEDALMRFAALPGLGIYALSAYFMIKELKDDWEKLKYVLKTLKNDGDNDDTYECEEHDDAYKDDAYKDDAYKYDAYDGYDDEDDICEEDDAYEYDDDEYDEEELEQKTIKERAWGIFANVLFKIPDEGVWGSIANFIIGLIGLTLVGACVAIVLLVPWYIVSTLIRACH